MNPEPVAFDALCTPPPSLDRRGARRWLLGFGGVVVVLGTGFAWFGAWPVLCFFGVEVALVAGLFALHRHATARPPERIRLVGGSLRVGEHTLMAYWTRVELVRGTHGPTRLLLRDRGTVLEVGRSLPETGREALAEALREALARHRRSPNELG